MQIWNLVWTDTTYEAGGSTINNCRVCSPTDFHCIVFVGGFCWNNGLAIVTGLLFSFTFRTHLDEWYGYERRLYSCSLFPICWLINKFSQLMNCTNVFLGTKICSILQGDSVWCNFCLALNFFPLLHFSVATFEFNKTIRNLASFLKPQKFCKFQEILKY